MSIELSDLYISKLGNMYRKLNIKVSNGVDQTDKKLTMYDIMTADTTGANPNISIDPEKYSLLLSKIKEYLKYLEEENIRKKYDMEIDDSEKKTGKQTETILRDTLEKLEKFLQVGDLQATSTENKDVRVPYIDMLIAQKTMENLDKAVSSDNKGAIAQYGKIYLKIRNKESRRNAYKEYYTEESRRDKMEYLNIFMLSTKDIEGKSEEQIVQSFQEKKRTIYKAYQNEIINITQGLNIKDFEGEIGIPIDDDIDRFPYNVNKLMNRLIKYIEGKESTSALNAPTYNPRSMGLQQGNYLSAGKALIRIKYMFKDIKIMHELYKELEGELENPEQDNDEQTQ